MKDEAIQALLDDTNNSDNIDSKESESTEDKCNCLSEDNDKFN